MSVKMMHIVWEHAPYAEGSLLVLLALADWANDEGESWPAMGTLAAKARLGERQAQRVLRGFEKDGIVTVRRGGGRSKQNVYRINTDILTGFPAALGKVSPASRKGDIGDAKRVTPTSPDPSIDPSEEPSGDPSVGAAAPMDNKKKRPKPYPPRSEWPKAIAIYFAVTGRAPLRQVWPLIEQRIGATPDVAKLKECYVQWIDRGFKEFNNGWLDWYQDGIPARLNGHAKKAAPDATETKAYKWPRPANWKESGIALNDPAYKWYGDEA